MAARADIDLGNLLALEKRLAAFPGAVKRVVRRARGTLLRRLPVQARRDITDEYNLKAGRVARDLRARAVAEGIELRGRERRIGVIEYGARWRRGQAGGATWQFRRGGPREAYDAGAFIATGLSGNRQVFIRAGAPRRMTRGRYIGQLRQPLSAQYEGSVAQFLRDDARRDRLLDTAQQIAAAEVDRLIAGEAR